MKRKIVRVQRQTRLSQSEAAAIKEVRNQIGDELPAIKARARALLAEARARSLVFRRASLPAPTRSFCPTLAPFLGVAGEMR